jgi:ABC-type transport system involved in cytochrome c biogenesis permease component
VKLAKAHALWELRLTLRNGEQLLLTLIIPVLLLIGLNATGMFSSSGTLSRIESAFPLVCMVSLIATCFTSLAIGTGFERRSGALTFLATTPLGRQGLVMGKVIATVMLAAQYKAWFAVVAGTTLGMMLANAPVVWLGDAITRRVPLRIVHLVSAGIFTVLGVVALSGWGS